MSWLQRIRLRALAVVAALTIVVVGAVSVASLPIWPVLGVAITAAALVLNTLASRFDQPTCLGCGHNLEGRANGPNGVTCPECGVVNQTMPRYSRQRPSPDDSGGTGGQPGGGS